MLVKRFNYLFVQATTVVVAVAAACLSPKPHASPASPPPENTPAVTGTPTATGTPGAITATPPAKDLAPEVRSVARAEHASFVTQVEFKQKSFDLTAAAQRQLAATVRRAHGAGRIEKIHLIVWADHEYPSTERKHLSADEIRLADRRAKAVNDFLKERSPDAITDAYNMAERPNAFQSLLSMTDARIKRSLEAAGIPTTARDLRTPEYASKTLVLVLLAE